jgi:hypothetical protein
VVIDPSLVGDDGWCFVRFVSDAVMRRLAAERCFAYTADGHVVTLVAWLSGHGHGRRARVQHMNGRLRTYPARCVVAVRPFREMMS